ncbi:MAG: SlyX family protein [Betaproteobacteria bacterium]|nr:SlyX family protein [Betaproteobacteria bacterium]MBM3637211.1 SlyX family protein [Alphaproteobacteria bacterium]
MTDHETSIRIAELEHRLTEQDRTISDLSEMVVAQWNKIDLLERRLKELRDEFEVSNEALNKAPEPPPPHY